MRSTGPGISEETSIPLSVDNVLWANTVLAAGSAIGLVVYTGKETRAVLNTSEPETKMGTLENEVNKMAKVSYVMRRSPKTVAQIQILCAVTFALSVFLVALNGFRGQWYIYVFRFLILFSSIIPIRQVSSRFPVYVY
jgi:phospholipid-translocating ATPase